MTAPTVLERAARLLDPAGWGDWMRVFKTDGVRYDPARFHATMKSMQDARAVIKALRDPSGAVLDAMLLGDPLWSMNVLPRLRDAWIRGIDAVLSETKEQK